MSISLTRRQVEIYEFLKAHQREFKYAPSLEQLCHALGLRSRGSMHKHIQALIQAGLVEPLNGKQHGIRLATAPTPNRLELPFVGDIAAGIPFHAYEQFETIDVPQHLTRHKACFVLRVKGDSMIDAGILDHDLVVIEKTNVANQNDIVVALVDNDDVTLKYFERGNDHVILKPANSNMSPMYFEPDRVQIQGILISQMRTYF